MMMVRPVATCLAVALFACTPGPVVGPGVDEVELRHVNPNQVRLPTGSASRACRDALIRTDRAIGEGALSDASASLVIAGQVCGAGHGVHWRRGWIARERREWDAAANAYLDELEGPAPAPMTGAQLLDVVSKADPRTQRRASRLGRDTKHAIHGGFSGVSVERIAQMRCKGKPVKGLRISCYRDPPHCESVFRCQGRRVRVVEASTW